ncbi:MAG: hypothetical protein EZS28_026778, partial [Streblomastix strix]
RSTLNAKKEPGKEEDDYIDSLQFSDLKAPNEQKPGNQKAGLKKSKLSENTKTLNSNQLQTTSAIPVYERLYREKEELELKRKILKEVWQEKQDRELDGDEQSLSEDMNATSQNKSGSGRFVLKGKQMQKKLRKRKLTRKENDDLMMILMHDAQMRLEQMLLNEWKLQVKEEQQLKTGQLTEDEKKQLLRRREIRAEQRKLQEKRAQKVLTELEQQINSAMDAEQKALQELIKQKQHKITVQLSPEEEEIDIDELVRDDTEMSGEKSLKDKKQKLDTLRRVLEKQGITEEEKKKLKQRKKEIRREARIEEIKKQKHEQRILDDQRRRQKIEKKKQMQKFGCFPDCYSLKRVYKIKI